MIGSLKNNEGRLDPVFVVGHPRSGSTLLVERLARHSDLFTVPETHIFTTSWSGKFWNQLLAKRNPNRFFSYFVERNLRLEDVKFDRDRLKSIFVDQNVVDRRTGTIMFFNELARQNNGARFVEKTPTHLEVVPRIISCFPDAKVICILRDGRDAVQSLMKAPWTHSNPQRHAAYWNWSVKTGLSLTSEFPKSVMLVRYEDLVLSPTEKLKEISGFLDVSYENNMLLGGESVGGVPKWEDQWKTSSAASINPDFAYKWRRESDKETIVWEGWMAEALSMLSYPLRGVEPTHRPLILNALVYQLFRRIRQFYYEWLSENHNRFTRRRKLN